MKGKEPYIKRKRAPAAYSDTSRSSDESEYEKFPNDPNWEP